MLFVRLDERLAQRADGALGRGGQHQLIWIRPALGTDGHGFPAPDELRAAQPEPLPPPEREIAWTAVGGSVPAFHREDREPVAHAHALRLERRAERRLACRRELTIEVEIDPRRAEVALEGVGGLERRHARIAITHRAPRAWTGMRNRTRAQLGCAFAPSARDPRDLSG